MWFTFFFSSKPKTGPNHTLLSSLFSIQHFILLLISAAGIRQSLYSGSCNKNRVSNEDSSLGQSQSVDSSLKEDSNPKVSSNPKVDSRVKMRILCPKEDSSPKQISSRKKTSRVQTRI